MLRSADALIKKKWKYRFILDVDSTDDPTYGNQEGCEYNGHFMEECFHPIFAFTGEGDALAGVLRPGKVHSADGTLDLIKPLVDRYRSRFQLFWFRGDAAFAKPEIYEYCEILMPRPWGHGVGARHAVPLHSSPAAPHGAWHPRRDENEQVAVSKGHMATQTSFPRRRESRLLHLGIQTKETEKQKRPGGLGRHNGAGSHDAWIPASAGMTKGAWVPIEKQTALRRTFSKEANE